MKPPTSLAEQPAAPMTVPLHLRLHRFPMGSRVDFPQGDYPHLMGMLVVGHTTMSDGSHRYVLSGSMPSVQSMVKHHDILEQELVASPAPKKPAARKRPGPKLGAAGVKALRGASK